MATPIEEGLFIAFNSIVALLEAKGLLTSTEVVEAMKLETKGRPDDVAAVLMEIAQKYTPKPPAVLRAIDGGKGDEPE